MMEPPGEQVEPAGPHVSILVPAYKPRFFEETLRSAMAQTYPDAEIVICDDCPDGRIEEIVSKAAGGDSRVRYERNRERQGPKGNYLRCLALARGDLVKFLNDDDLMEPDCVERMTAVIDDNADVALVACRRERIDAQGRAVRAVVSPQPLAGFDACIESRSLARVLLSLGVNWIGEPTATIFRRRDVGDIRPDLFSFGGESVPGFGDFALNLNLLNKGNLAYLADPLVKIREHPEQHQRNPELRSRAVNSIYILRRHASDLGMYRRVGGMPDPLGLLGGYKYRPLGAPGSWKRKRPGPVQWLVFAKKFAGAGVAAVARFIVSGRKRQVAK